MKKEISIKRFITSHDIGASIFPNTDGPTYRYHDRLPYCQKLFHKHLDKDGWKYTQNPSSSFEKIKKAFSKRSQNVLLLHLKIYRHYRNIYSQRQLSSIFLPNQTEVSRIPLDSRYFPRILRGEGIFTTDTPRVKDGTRSKISHASIIDDDSKQKMGQIRRDVASFLPREKVRNDNSRAGVTRVTDEKYYSIGEFFRVCKNLYTVFEMQFNERGKRGKRLRESEKKKGDDYYPFRSSVNSARFFLDSGEKPKQIVFQSIRFFASLRKIL